jgi:indolepyruvate ferredoxin oxidoreductase, beta subunit
MKNDNSINSSIEGSVSSIQEGQRVSDNTVDREAYLENGKKLLNGGETVSVLFTGVGGQGIILTTTVLAKAVMLAGYDVKVSEVHGMAQRGGSVVGSVRFGKKVYSPIIDKADFIIALEKLEAARYLEMLKPGGFLLINDFEVYPVSIYLSKRKYPSDILTNISKVTPNYKLVEAADIASRLKEVRASNMVLIGSLSKYLPVEKKYWLESISESVPERALKINIDAFNKGREIFN